MRDIMSTVVTVDDETYVIRYGGYDSNTSGKEHCWIHLYRPEGIRVVIYVKAEDVEDTPFAEKWLRLFKTGVPGTTVQGNDMWMQRWVSLCEVVIDVCKDKVRELVQELVDDKVQDVGGSNRGWLTLEGYLRTVGWSLEVVKNEDTGGHDTENDGVVAQIVRGPELVPAYELWPTDVRDLPELEELLPGLGRPWIKQSKTSWPVPVYAAKDVHVFDAWADWCDAPRKVRCPDGKEYVFVMCENTSRRLGGHGAPWQNPSRDTINAHARIRAYQELARQTGSTDHCHDLRIPGLRGVVVTNVKYDQASHPERESLRLGHAPTDNAEKNAYSGDDNGGGGGGDDDDRDAGATMLARTRVAGILLDALPDQMKLTDYYFRMEKLGGNPQVTTELRKKWHDEILRTVKFLHGIGITIGGETWGRGKNEMTASYINHYTLFFSPMKGGAIHHSTKIWLTLESGCTVHDEDDEDGLMKNVTVDEGQIADVFRSWAWTSRM